ncbi:MAG: MarR family transcriptional regulator [Salinibacterium sp.]|nr:MarR family transcriptional regulator [Salinibacterium sp.]
MLNNVPDLPEDDLRIAIMRLSRRMRAERAGDTVTDGQLSVLFVLWKEGAQTLSSLADHERVTPPSMNRTVNALVDAGLVTRDSSPEDGRKVLLQCTTAGLEVVRETKRRRVAWFARQLDTLTPQQRATIDAATPILRELADS